MNFLHLYTISTITLIISAFLTGYLVGTFLERMRLK